MTKHSSATPRKRSPHGPKRTPNARQTTRTATIMNALTRRAQAVLNDTSIDPQTRNLIRYGMEINDPWLAELVRCAEARESMETIGFSQTP